MSIQLELNLVDLKISRTNRKKNKLVNNKPFVSIIKVIEAMDQKEVLLLNQIHQKFNIHVSKVMVIKRILIMIFN